MTFSSLSPMNSGGRKCSVEGIIAMCSNRDSLFRTDRGIARLVLVTPTLLVKTLGSPERNCKLNFIVKSSSTQNDQIMLRVSKIHNGELTIDEYPRGMSVEVNGTVIAVNGGGRPLDISSALERDIRRKNEVILGFSPYQTKTYIATVFVTGDARNCQGTEGEYFRKIIKTRPSEKMEERIRSFFTSSDDIGVKQLEVSLKCPFTLKKIVNPCITWKCRHITCFDAASFLCSNAARPKCPICRVECHFRDLLIDG